MSLLELKLQEYAEAEKLMSAHLEASRYNKLPVGTFYETIYPFLKNSNIEEYPKLLNLWGKLANSPYCGFELIDEQKNVLLRVPPLQSNHYGLARAATHPGDTVRELAARAEKEVEYSQHLGDQMLIGGLSAKLDGNLNKFDVDLAAQWNSVFEYFGDDPIYKITRPVDEDLSETENSVDETDIEEELEMF